MCYKAIIQKEKQLKAKHMQKSKVASQVMFTKQLTLAKFLKAWKEYDKNSDRCKLACSLYWVY